MRYRRMLVCLNTIDFPTSKILAAMFLYFPRKPSRPSPVAYLISYRTSFVTCITLTLVFNSGLHNVYFREPTDVANVDLSRFSLLPNNLVYALFYTSLI